MTQKQIDEFVTGGKCVAKRDAYQLKQSENGEWIQNEIDDSRLLTIGKQYNICLKGSRSIKVIDDRGDASIWTFQSEDQNYSFPFYTKEDLRESILGKILK